MGKEIETKICEVCGKVFSKPKKYSRTQWRKRRFCLPNCAYKNKSMDLAGQRFGRLIAIEPTKKRKGKGVIWRCLCDCGNECFVGIGNLRSGTTKSCGCFALDVRTTHGRYRTREYGSWDSMIQRCENPNCSAFKNYGGRGIIVSEEFHDFQIWYEHIGPRPGPGYSQDRIDNEGNYERGNIQWSTRLEQQNNRRSTSYGPSKQRWFFAFNLETGEWFENDNQSKFAREHGLRREYVRDCLQKKRKIYENWVFEHLA